MGMEEVEDAPEVWHWYCRIDGTKGSASTRALRDEAASFHRDEVCRTKDLPNVGASEYGHLMHVWRY